MPKAQVRVFSGMRPARSSDLLRPGEAQYALNTRLTGGDLDSFLGLATPSTGLTLVSSSVRTIYRFGQTSSKELLYWFQSVYDVDFVRGPVDLDTTERTYWTDYSPATSTVPNTSGYPKKTDAALATSGTPYPAASYRLGMPAPVVAPTVAVTGTATNPADPGETIIYCMTYVSIWGEEGPPSALSAAVLLKPGQSVSVSGLPTAPGAGYNTPGKRLYRSATGSTGTKFQLVNTEGDIALATTTYSDTKLTAALGETLVTTGWVAPPDTLTGLCAMANGILVGFTGNTLCFSVSFAPYAWPVRYRQSVDAPIVGIAAIEQSVFVGTTQGIYIFTGSDPGQMSSEKLPVQQSCVSKRSIVVMQGGVMFASPDGLMRYSSSGLENVTDGLMTRLEWQAYVPSSINAYESDNRYVAFFDTGSRQAGMIFSFGSSPTFSETDVYATAGFRDRQRDALYLCVAGVLKKWDAGSPLTYNWTSGVFHFPREVNMACARVDASAYPITFQLYADGVAVGSALNVASRYGFRLPSGYRSARYSFSLTGTSTVREVTIATAMKELGSE